MSLLGTDPRVAFDRCYPFEHRYLTFLAKQAILAGRCRPSDIHDGFRMCSVDNNTGTTPAWWPLSNMLMSLSSVVLLSDMWNRFCEQMNRAAPSATHYAEKAPFWLADQYRPLTKTRVIHLVRDPRDVYLSVRAFAHANKQLDSSKLSGDFDAEQARDMAHQLSCFAEAERLDRGRDDAILVRYEDWVADNNSVGIRLSKWSGLQLNAASEDVSRHVGHHRTSKDVASSKGRFHREGLPQVVADFLLPSLGRYGDDYGYDLPNTIADLIPNAERPHSVNAELSHSSLGVHLTIRGPDAWIEMLDEPIQTDAFSEVWVSLRGSTGDTCSAYWCHEGEEYDESRVVHLPFFPGPHVQMMRFAVFRHVAWTGTIHRLRIDVCNGNVTIGQVVDVHWVRLVR